MPGKKGIPVVNLTTGERYPSTKDAAEAIGTLPSTLTNHLRGRTRTLYKQIFEYASNLDATQIESLPN